MADGAKFEVGKIYGHSFIGDSDARVYWRVSSRSGSMMTIESVGWGQKESRRVKIRERPGEGEWAYSMGQYSMAPIIRANKEGKFSRSGEKDMMAAGDMTTPEAIAKMMEAWNKIEAQAKKQFPNASKEELYRITKSAMESALKFKFSRPGAKATFKIEDRFYFGKGRKERFGASDKVDGLIATAYRALRNGDKAAARRLIASAEALVQSDSSVPNYIVNELKDLKKSLSF
jgi:hypothetical protein